MPFQPDPDALRWRLHLASPPETVWEALATGSGRARFWAELLDPERVRGPFEEDAWEDLVRTAQTSIM